MMKLKNTKGVDIDSKLKEFLIKNNDKSSLTDSIKEFFANLAQNRNVMAKMGDNKKTPEQIKENITIITSYVNQINQLRKKITFGKEQHSFKMEFTWFDTIKNVNCKSFDIIFELCNAIYNLATFYFIEGMNISGDPSANKDTRKEATNSFKHAMYLFNYIKEEAQKIQPKELPMDLSSNYLDYCITLSELKGQIEIYHIAKEATPKQFGLHAKLNMAISELFNKIAGLYGSLQMKKSTSEQVMYYKNRSIYYKAKMYIDLKDDSRAKFDEKGTGFGEVVYFINLAINEYTECQKTVKKLSKFLKIQDFETEFNQVKEEQKEAEDHNNRLYHQVLPKDEEINLESKNMMSMTLPEELYIEENESKAKDDDRIYCKDLDLIAPKEIKDMIENFKPKMNELIAQNLDKYENEGTISNFVQELNLPCNLTKKPLKEGEIEIQEVDPLKRLPDELWEKIQKIQEIGGINGLHNIMQGIMGKSNFLINTLQNLLLSFEAEDKDDQKCRQRFRDKWFREPSIKLNFQMVQAAQQYIKSIQQTQAFDQQASNEISVDAQYFEELMLPLLQLNRNIPKENKVVEENPSEKQVKAEILKLYELSDKCTAIIKPIFDSINNDSNLVDEFMEVLNRKETEQSIYEKKKGIYLAKFDELQKVSDEVKKQEEVITELVNNNRDRIMPKINELEKNRIFDYFRHLDELANRFMDKYEKIMKGDKYYNELKEKVDKLAKFSNDWMIKRSDEKNALIKSMGSNYRGY